MGGVTWGGRDMVVRRKKQMSGIARLQPVGTGVLLAEVQKARRKTTWRK